MMSKKERRRLTAEMLKISNKAVYEYYFGSKTKSKQLKQEAREIVDKLNEDLRGPINEGGERYERTTGNNTEES